MTPPLAFSTWPASPPCASLVRLAMPEHEPNQRLTDPDLEQPHREAAELMGRIARGDGAALSELYERFSGALFARCLTMLEDRAEAQDTLQEVFLLVWSRASSYDPALGKVVSWLMTITRNKCLDRIRASRRKRAALERASEEWTAPQPRPGSDAFVGKERQEQISKALLQLPENQRRAIEMAFLSGYTQVEVATLLGEPLGTVKARIRRGMQLMRALLDRDSNAGDSPGEAHGSTTTQQ